MIDGMTDADFLSELGDRLLGEQLISIEIHKRLMKIVESLNEDQDHD